MAEFLMPSLGADMEAGTLVEWLKQPGEAVSRGDIVAVVETQKGAIEIESFQDGTLDRYLVDVGQKVPVGTPLAVIDGDEAERAAAPAAPAPERSAPPAPAPAEQELREPKPQPALAAGERLRITPAAMRLAEQSGIDPRDAGLTGSGPQGAITLEDVEALLKQGKAAAPKATPAPEGMRAAIAAAMSRSKREIPHYYLSHSVDLTAAQAFVTARNEGRPPEERLLLGALYLAAVTRALKKYAEFNGHYTDNAFHPAEVVNAGMAFTIRGGGLVAPAILDAGAMDLDALMTAMRDLAARVRAGRFRASELSEATITVSSLGERGVEQLYAVIYPPQVAIVGVGTPTERAVVTEGRIEPRLGVTLTLAADHRVSDGHRGALFLRAIDKHLQAPETL